MKQVFQLIVFLILVVLLDAGIGRVLKESYSFSSDNRVSKLRFCWREVTPHWVVLGSSRALHHYNIGSIQQELGWDNGFNAGMDGQGLLASKLFLVSQMSNKDLNTVVLDVAPGIIADVDSESKLSYLFPEINLNDDVKREVFQNMPLERISFLSSIYPYNSRIVDILFPKQNVHLDAYKKTLGFEPLAPNESMRKLDISLDVSNVDVQERIDKSLALLDDIKNWCDVRGIRLIMVVSPIFDISQSHRRVLEKVKERMELLDFSQMGNGHPSWFNDDLHLNETGAEVFSDSLTIYLKNRYYK